MIDGYKELTPVIYGENAIKYLYTEQKKAEGEICFLLHWHDRMELTYVTKGTLRFVTEGEEFLVSAGELAVAGPGQMHGGFAVSEKVCYHTVMFDVERFYNGTAASEKYLRSLGNGELTFVEKIAGERGFRAAGTPGGAAGRKGQRKRQQKLAGSYRNAV